METLTTIRERRPRKRNLTLDLPRQDANIGSNCQQVEEAMPTAADPSGGEHRLCDFEEIKVLGHGNGGTVYLVRHRLTGSPYALKKLKTFDSPRQRRFAREVEIHRRTNCSTLLRCHSVFRDALLLEFMDGGSLETSLLARGGEPFPEFAIVRIASQVLHALSYLHSHNIVHLDIKPGNILANTAGDIKIADFGISQIIQPSLETCGFDVGTHEYMSPERFDRDVFGGNHDDAYKADVWSLGMTLLQLHFGHYPLLLPSGKRRDMASLMCVILLGEMPEMLESASSDFRDFIDGCLQKDSRKRLSVAQLLAHPFVLGVNDGDIILPAATVDT